MKHNDIVTIADGQPHAGSRVRVLNTNASVGIALVEMLTDSDGNDISGAVRKMRLSWLTQPKPKRAKKPKPVASDELSAEDDE